MAVTADSVVIELVAKTASHDAALNGSANVSQAAMSKIERSAAQAEAQVLRSSQAMGGAVIRASGDFERGAARSANASRNLGRQVADVGAQAAGGQSPFLILAQQAPQVADALADTQGRAARVAAFFAGPWGAALLAAGSVLGVLVGKALEAGESVDDLVRKLEANAARSRTAAEAQAIFERSLYGSAAASDALNAKLKTQNQTQIEVARSSLAAAEAQRQLAIRNLRTETSQLAIAQSQARANANPLNFIGGSVPGASAMAQATAQARSASALAEATRRYRDAQARLAVEQSSVVEARIPLLDMRAKEATDQAAASTGRYERAVASLRAEFRKTGDQEKYVSGLVKAQRERDASTQSGNSAGGRINVAISGRRQLASATNDVTKAERDLDNALADIQRRFDPAASAASDLADQLQRIADLQASGRISPTQADQYKAGAQSNFVRARADAFSLPFVEQLKDDQGRADADAKAAADIEERARADAEDRIQRIREDNVRTVAGLYMDLFEGGTRSVWSSFKRLGFQVLAELLAKQTVAGAGGGGFGSILSSIGSFFGRASGGYVGPGQTVRVNESRGGVELLRMGSQGGTVIPLGQAAAQRSGGNVVTVPVSLSIDARGADSGAAAQIDAAAARLRAEFPSIAVAAVRNAQERFAL